MSLSIRQLKAFLALAESRSFTQAARKLHISQPGLSLMLREMEMQLKATLLQRTTRSCDLTAAGEKLLPVALRIVEEYEAVIPVLGDLSQQRYAPLTIAATPMFTVSFMPGVILALRNQVPPVAIQLIEATRAEVETLVLEGRVDCGLGIFGKRISGLVREPIFSYEFVYIESRQAPFVFRHRPPHRLRWRDLPDTDFVQLQASSNVQKLIDNQIRLAGLKPLSAAYTLGSFESLIAMTRAGVGPAIVPSFAIGPDMHQHLFVEPLFDPDLRMDFHLVRRSGRDELPSIPALRRALQQQIQRRSVEAVANQSQTTRSGRAPKRRNPGKRDQA